MVPTIRPPPSVSIGLRLTSTGIFFPVLANGDKLQSDAHRSRSWLLQIGIAVFNMPVAQVGRNQRFQQLADEFGFGVAEHALRLGVCHFNVTISIHQQYGIGSRFHDHLELFSSLGKLPVFLGQLMDVG